MMNHRRLLKVTILIMSLTNFIKSELFNFFSRFVNFSTKQVFGDRKIKLIIFKTSTCCNKTLMEAKIERSIFMKSCFVSIKKNSGAL